MEHRLDKIHYIPEAYLPALDPSEMSLFSRHVFPTSCSHGRASAVGTGLTSHSSSAGVRGALHPSRSTARRPWSSFFLLLGFWGDPAWVPPGGLPSPCRADQKVKTQPLVETVAYISTRALSLFFFFFFFFRLGSGETPWDLPGRMPSPCRAELSV